MLLFSCSVNDSPASEEPASLTPEQQLAELLIKDDAVWTDFDNYDIHKHLRVWNFNSDGTMEYMMFGSAETNGDYLVMGLVMGTGNLGTGACFHANFLLYF